MMFVSLGIGTVAAVALIVVMSILTGGSVKSPNGLPTSALVGTRVATFSLSGLNGGTERAPWASGHPSALIFFASWCSPCRGEIPKVAKYLSSHHDGNVVVMGIDAGDENSAAKAFTKKDHVKFPVAFDPHDDVTAGIFKFGQLPETVFLNAKGVVEYVRFGAISTAELAQRIATLKTA
jgi:thiol-disulfide isomerase/thioredoxin